jgi:CheY-like chemotaxis protein
MVPTLLWQGGSGIGGGTHIGVGSLGATRCREAERRRLRVSTQVLDLAPCHSAAMVRTVLVVDDSAAFREATSALLLSEGFVVVGEAADGRSGLELAVTLQPDLVLLDVQLPDLDGFEVARRLAADHGGGARVVLVSTRSAASLRVGLSCTTAAGFLAKQDLTGEALRRLLDDPAHDP